MYMYITALQNTVTAILARNIIPFARHPKQRIPPFPFKKDPNSFARIYIYREKTYTVHVQYYTHTFHTSLLPSLV